MLSRVLWTVSQHHTQLQKRTNIFPPSSSLNGTGSTVGMFVAFVAAKRHHFTALFSVRPTRKCPITGPGTGVAFFWMRVARFSSQVLLLRDASNGSKLLSVTMIMRACMKMSVREVWFVTCERFFFVCVNSRSSDGGTKERVGFAKGYHRD